MNVEYTAQIWQEGDQFVAHAMPLDVMSAGRTPDEARKALDEAVHLFLVTAADMGTLDDVLQERPPALRLHAKRAAIARTRGPASRGQLLSRCTMKCRFPSSATISRQQASHAMSISAF